MATILTSATIVNAKNAVGVYTTSVNGLNAELASIIKTLTTANFCGAASDGYTAFYNEKVVPALTQNLTDPSGSLMASINNMLDSIKTQLLDTTDPQMGENNRNPGTGVQ